MNRVIIALYTTTALVASTSAFAAKCNVVGTWQDSYNTTFTMTTDTKGTAGSNQECNNETANIKTTALSKTVWDLQITSKKCSTVITADYNFDKGSCTSATGTITIPGAGTLNDTITKTSSTVAGRPGSSSSALTRGMK